MLPSSHTVPRMPDYSASLRLLCPNPYSEPGLIALAPQSESKTIFENETSSVHSGHLVLYPALFALPRAVDISDIFALLILVLVRSQLCRSDIPYPCCDEAKAIVCLKLGRFLCSFERPTNKRQNFERSAPDLYHALARGRQRKLHSTQHRSIHIEIAFQDTFLKGIRLLPSGLWWGSGRDRGSGRTWGITNTLGPLMHRHIKSLIIRGRA